MSMESTMVRFGGFFRTLPPAVMVLSIASFGCGSSEDTTQWETTPTVSTTAQLEFRVDSLKNANRRLQDQVDATAAENRTLTAKVAELETKVSEAAAAPKVAAVAPSDMNAAYEAAVGQWRKKNYSGAIDQFQNLLNSGIETRLAGNCHYWIGESYFGLKQYNEAIQEFQKVMGYTHSPKKDYAQLMLGNCFERLGDKASAKDAFEKLVSTFPASALVKDAQAKLAKMK